MAEDPLTYLPRKASQEVPKGAVIYSPDTPNAYLYVVIGGRVRITHDSPGGGHTIGRIVRSDGLFGESVLGRKPAPSESAVAMDDVTIMSWTREEVERQIEREPRLGLALCQSLVRQGLELQKRIESMAVYKTPERVMLALLALAGDLGTEMPDGTVRIPSLTHHTLAEYVGTSREVVTFQMNRLRRLGLIRYSRQFIDVHPKPLREALKADQSQAAQAVHLECHHLARRSHVFRQGVVRQGGDADGPVGHFGAEVASQRQQRQHHPLRGLINGHALDAFLKLQPLPDQGLAQSQAQPRFAFDLPLHFLARPRHHGYVVHRHGGFRRRRPAAQRRFPEQSLRPHDTSDRVAAADRRMGDAHTSADHHI